MITEGLLKAGARVYISSRNEVDCDAAAKSLQCMGECVSIPADITTVEGRSRITTTIGSSTDGLNALINNAGISHGAGYKDYATSDFERVFETNVTALFALSRDLTPLLESNATLEDPSRIINIGSIDGLHQTTVERTGTFAYVASKAAVHQLTKQLAVELRSQCISVNAIAPGYFVSRMTDKFIGKFGDNLKQNALIGRIGEPSDIAGAAIFLCSRAGAYVNGIILPVDGGTSINHQHVAI